MPTAPRPVRAEEDRSAAAEDPVPTGLDPSSQTVEWEVLAVRFSRLQRHHRDALLLCPEPLGGEPLDMDYSFWVLRSGARTVLVDTGYSADLAARRGRTFLADPIQTLRDAGVDPRAVSDVVLTHLHYDHAGNLPSFPNATVHLHRAELGPPAWQLGEAAVAFAYDADHVAAVEQAAAEERLQLIDDRGQTDLAAGVELHHLPGHTPGHLGVRVRSRRGWILLAGDSVHVEANLRHRRPFPLFSDLAKTFQDYDRVLELAGDLDHLIAGHEATVIDRYPALSPELAGRVARLDQEPDSAR